MLQTHPSQILQSPSRLAFTNPNSPAISNPQTPTTSTPPPPTPPPQSQPTTSSNLLSLLPPHTRAQSLLHQMSTLTTKLFQLSPHKSNWLSNYRGSFPTFLSQVNNPNLLPLEFTPGNIKDAVVHFTTLQTQLFEAVSELQEILDLQVRNNELARQVQEKDVAVLAFAQKVKEVENVLDALVDDYADYRRPKRVKGGAGVGEGEKEEGIISLGSFDSSSVNSKLNLSEVIAYAHRVSYTTFAPPEGPSRASLPPAPQEAQMRASQLYTFADLDIGLPKEVDSKEGLVEEDVVERMNVDSKAGGVGVRDVVPQITVPSGWRPGMPIELPSDLPLPPSGWKPGDPIPLPPLAAESRPVSQVPFRPLEANQPIQVGFVNIDIPDEDSSDYSSEEDDED